MATLSAIRPYVGDKLPNCPDPVVDRAVRLAARELCEAAAIWQAELDPIDLAAGTQIYDLTHDTGDIVRVTKYGVRLDGAALRQMSLTEAYRRDPDWRTTQGTPESFVAMTPRQLALTPVPDTMGALDVRVVLRPTLTTDELPTEVESDWREALISGALYRLYSMPNDEWASGEMAKWHQQVFQRERDQAVAAHGRGYRRADGRSTTASTATERRRG